MRKLSCHNSRMNAWLPLAAVAALAAPFATAQVYRCTTPGGGVEYSQVPCGKDAVQVQSRKDSIYTGPPTDPFGVERERARVQAQTEQRQRQFWSGATAPRPTTPLAPARPFDPAACERADREAKIEAGHARKDAAAIKRAQKLADWTCGRDIPDDPVAPSARQTTTIPIVTPPPVITNCDGAGCWDTAGNRYNRVGGNTFVGPNGACTKAGPTLVCP